jgi:hypothetical protein
VGVNLKFALERARKVFFTIERGMIKQFLVMKRRHRQAGVVYPMPNKGHLEGALGL